LARELLEGGRVKGGLLRSHLQWAAERQPPLKLEAICERVSAESARVLRAPILTLGWYPFRTVIETDRAIAALAGGMDLKESVIALGRYSARINLTTNYRVYNRSQPHEFFLSAAQLHSHFLDFGRAEYTRTGPTACRLSMRDYPCFSEVFCWSARGYYEEATLLQGGRTPKVIEATCMCRGEESCDFEIRWS
jgi:hypothetical protein